MTDLATGRPAERASSRRRPGRPRGLGDGVVILAATAFALFLGLPVVALIVRSILTGALRDAATSEVVLTALWLSLTTTTVAMAAVIVFGFPLAFVLARRTFRGRWLVEAVVDLPIVLPPSVAGLALLLVFGRRGVIGETLSVAGIDIPFTTAAVVIAQVFVAAPFFIRSARAGLAAVDRDLEDAARVDGASEAHLFRRITVPLAAGTIAGGIVMSWARALGEFGATIMFAGNIEGRTQTLPLVVYAEFQAGDLEASVAAASILVLAALGVLLAVRVFHWGRVLDARGGA